MPKEIFSKEDYFKLLDDMLKPSEIEKPPLPQLAEKIKSIAKKRLPFEWMK